MIEGTSDSGSLNLVETAVAAVGVQLFLLLEPGMPGSDRIVVMGWQKY
jgi:hypothetical protein